MCKWATWAYCTSLLAGCTCDKQPSVRPALGGEAAWQAGRLTLDPAAKPRDGGELVVGVDVDPSSLNPITGNDWLGKQIVMHHVYESLVRVDAADDPDYRIRPELASSWEISADGRTYTFHLRAGVKWHDGQPFSARDVLATFDKLSDPAVNAASTRADFAELERYSSPDASTFVLEWKRPYFLVLDALADLPIQPAHVLATLSPAQYDEAATNPLQRHPIGTGPFTFERWESASQIALQRNPHYWGARPHIDHLVFRVVPDPGVRLQLAERGEIDLMYRVKSEQWAHMDSPSLRAHWQRSRFYAAKYTWIGWNLARPLFAQREVRRALTLLIDRPSIIDKLMYALPKPANCIFYWASAACDQSAAPMPHDPERARQLLDQSGFVDHDGDGVRDRDGVPFRFVLSVPSGSVEMARSATKIKEDLAREGIEMELEKVEWSALLKRADAHDFDALALIWGNDARMDATQIWHSSSIEGGSNFVGFRDAEADRLIEQARATLDADARNALYRKLGEILTREQPYTFLYIPAELDLLHERVKGARPSLYWWQFESMWLDPPERRKS